MKNARLGLAVLTIFTLSQISDAASPSNVGTLRLVKINAVTSDRFPDMNKVEAFPVGVSVAGQIPFSLTQPVLASNISFSFDLFYKSQLESDSVASLPESCRVTVNVKDLKLTRYASGDRWEYTGPLHMVEEFRQSDGKKITRTSDYGGRVWMTAQRGERPTALMAEFATNQYRSLPTFKNTVSFGIQSMPRPANTARVSGAF
jgi:hypothetical protein